MKIVVCIKQVPDTVEVKIDPKTGTLIRDGVPSIINHDDKTGIEAALQLREQLGGTVTVVSMGPPQADVALREALAMGCDEAILVSGREFGGSDTYATSGIIAAALKQLDFDLIITGRQAIDGDTAQVGPQVAEKLNMPQVTYAEEVLEITDSNIVIRRRLERGIEVVSSPMPLLITVHATAAPCRPRNAKFLMKYKSARTVTEDSSVSDAMKITEWGAAEIGGDDNSFGLSGSPTKVKKVENIVFQAKEAKRLTSSDADIDSLISELFTNHTIG